MIRGGAQTENRLLDPRPIQGPRRVWVGYGGRPMIELFWAEILEEYEWAMRSAEGEAKDEQQTESLPASRGEGTR